MFIFCFDTKNEPKKIKASADSFVAYLLDISLTHRDESYFLAKLKKSARHLFRTILETTQCSLLKQVRLPFHA